MHPSPTLRRALVAVLGVLLASTASVTSTAVSPAAAAEDPAPPAAPLAVAERLLDGQRAAGDPSVTVALRDLRRALPDLRGEEQRLARSALARPTDRGDQFAYDAPSTRTCNRTFCIHHTTSGVDAPPSAEWVAQVLGVMTSVYDREVGDLGFRAPLRDGRRGGDGRFDVYLVDLGPDGLYGYCAPEERRTARTYAAYCALDNDYDPAQYAGRAAESSLLVTAAHEFFHAIQFGYDATEDPWLLESTATWMEEQVADEIDDNRQYLPLGQLVAPQVPLDAFGDTFYQYGNWLWWQYLTETRGRGVVRKVWRAAAGPARSLPALDRLLRDSGGLRKTFARYAAANLDPARTYAEGAEIAALFPPAVPTTTLSAAQTRIPKQAFRVDHLASSSARLVPSADLADPALTLRLRLTAPGRRTSPTVAVSVAGVDGSRRTRLVRPDRSGRARVEVPFSVATVTAVDVTLVNASTRFRCGRGTQLACAGVPLDDRARFTVRGVVR